MTFLRSTTNRIRMLALLMLAGATLSACAPTPEPTPTPTAAFASEEEAFAAAEEVYRAYINASNQVDFEDPSTFEALAHYTAGDYLSEEREQLSEMHAQGYVRGGAIEVVTFVGTSVEPDGSVIAQTCNDVSGTTFTDAEGNNLVPSDRPDRYALRLNFSSESDELYLVSADSINDPSCVG